MTRIPSAAIGMAMKVSGRSRSPSTMRPSNALTNGIALNRKTTLATVVLLSAKKNPAGDAPLMTAATTPSRPMPRSLAIAAPRFIQIR